MKNLNHLLLLFSFLSLFSISAHAQYYKFELMKKASYTGHILSSDDRGNLLIGSQSKLIKLDVNGEFINHYQPLFPGTITCIDAKDPRRILVYYKSYAYVLFLNQDLINAGSLSIYQSQANPEPVDLADVNLSYVKLACLDEYNDSYWLYDDNNSDLILMDQDNNIDFRGEALDEYTELEPDPNYMIMESNRLFINNPMTGVYIFNENGRFVRKLPLMGLKKVQAFGDMLYYASNSFLVAYNLVTEEESYHPLPVFNFKDWTLNLNSKPARINFLTSEGVMIYSMEMDK